MGSRQSKSRRIAAETSPRSFSSLTQILFTKGVVILDPNVLVDPQFLVAPRARKRADELLGLFQPLHRRNGSRDAKENIVIVKLEFPQPLVLLAPYLPFLSELHQFLGGTIQQWTKITLR